MYDTYHWPDLIDSQNDFQHLHQQEIRKALGEVEAILIKKGADYNNLGIMADQFPFGDKSWATLLWIKARRIASVIQANKTNFESLEDSILDLMAYATAYLAWRRANASGRDRT